MARLVISLTLIAVGLLAACCDANKTVYRYESDAPQAPAPPSVTIQELANTSKSFGDFGLEIYAPVSDVVENELCRNHSRQFLEAVMKRQTWASKMLDASSKLPPSGLLDGNLVLLGNYDECLAVEHVNSEYGEFSGRHCMVALGASSYFTETTLTGKWIEYPKLADVFRYMDDAEATPTELREFLSHVGITWSVCIPSSCEPGDLQLHLEHALRPMLGDVAVSTSELVCNSRADPAEQIQPQDWFVIGVLLTVLCVAIGSTIFDVLTVKKEWRPWPLLAFSVYSNGRALLSKEQSVDAIPALDGLRVFSILWVILVHQYQYSLYGPIINLRSLQQMGADMNLLSFTNGSLCVDSFLLFSGLLLAYNYMRSMERDSFSLMRFYLSRYIRLTPSYAVMLMLSATVVNLLGDGPFVRPNHNVGRETCGKAAWTSLIYLNNYLDTERSCLPAGWYLGMDMQLFWLSPLILYPLWRFKKLGKLLYGSLIMLGIAVAFTIPYVNRIPLHDFMGAISGADGNSQYYPTHARFTAWLIGVGLGAALHATRKTTLVLPPYVLALGWLLNNVLINGAMLPFILFFQPGYEYEPITTSLYTALRRPAWALGLGWIVFTCARGYGGFMNKVLSWRVFRVMSRLSYSVFLTHWTVIAGQTVFKKTPEQFNNFSMITQYFGICVISFSVGIYLYLLFEAPASIIGKALLEKPTPIKKVKSTPT